MAQFFWTQLPLSCMADGYSRYRFQYFHFTGYRVNQDFCDYFRFADNAPRIESYCSFASFHSMKKSW
jgi:hypothetical protein